LGALGIAATDASAREDPEPAYGNTIPELTYPNYDPQHHGNMTNPEYNSPRYDFPKYELDVPALPADPTDASVDDAGAEALQAGASALGGASLAFGGMWLYRRRHAPTI